MKKLCLFLALSAMTASLFTAPAQAQDIIVNNAVDTVSVPVADEFLGEVILTKAAKKAIKKAKKNIKKKVKSGTLLPVSKKLFPSKGSRAVRIFTYNVGTFTKSGYDKTNTVVDMMTEAKADIVCLNELDSCTTRTDGIYQLAAFAEGMGGWNYNFTSAMPYKGGSYGIGIASAPKRKILDQWGITLDKGKGAEQRALSVVEFDKFVVACTHLDHKSDAAQLAQAKAITNEIDRRYHSSHKTVILCGDMNAVPTSKTIKEFEKNWTLVTANEKTYTSAKPSKCIDYIFVFNNASKYKVKRTAVGSEFSCGNVAEASDHLPVYIDIVIK